MDAIDGFAIGMRFIVLTSTGDCNRIFIATRRDIGRPLAPVMTGCIDCDVLICIANGTLDLAYTVFCTGRRVNYYRMFNIPVVRSYVLSALIGSSTSGIGTFSPVIELIGLVEVGGVGMLMTVGNDELEVEGVFLTCKST